VRLRRASVEARFAANGRDPCSTEARPRKDSALHEPGGASLRRLAQSEAAPCHRRGEVCGQWVAIPARRRHALV